MTVSLAQGDAGRKRAARHSEERRVGGLEGGACEIVQYARRSLLLSPLQERRFPERVGFVTSAPPADAEILVVTDKCVLRRAPGEEEMELWRIYDGVEVDEVDAVVGWSLKCSADLERMTIGGAEDDA